MSGYPLLDAFLTIFWLFIWIMWIFLLIRVISDVFRSHDLSGAGKAGWTLVLIFFPLIGVLIYLLVRGDGMHHARRARRRRAKRRCATTSIGSPVLGEHRRRTEQARRAA